MRHCYLHDFFPQKVIVLLHVFRIQNGLMEIMKNSRADKAYRKERQIICFLFDPPKDSANSVAKCGSQNEMYRT